MKLSNLFILNTVIALPFGLGFLIAPGALAGLYGVTSNPATDLVGQFFGLSLVTIGLVTWYFRYIEDDDAQRAVMRGLLVGDALGLIVGLIGTLGGVINALGWLTVVLYLILVLGYGYFLFMKPRGS